MTGTSPVVGEANAPGGNVLVAGSIATVILNNGQKESRLFAGVPPLPKAFVGGDERLAELRGRIVGGGVLALEGTGGVGKTALATALAWDADVLAHFSGGVLWASLGPSPNADELLNRWAEALGIDVTHERTTEQRAAHIQSKLGERKFLFVLDDAWQETPADLLCRIAAPGCAHLLTTRDHTIASRLASEKPQPVKELPESHAITLLATLCPIAAQTDEEALRRLAHAAGGLPLALTLIGGYLADNITFSAEVPQVLQDLAQAEAWLGLEHRERRLTLAQVVELSIAALPDDVRQAFTRLAPFAAKPASFSLEAAQAVSGGDLAALGTLVRRNLLEKLTEERVAMHAVVAACAERHARGDGALADRHARYYLDWANEDPSAWRRIEAEWAQIQQGWRWVVGNRDEETLAYAEVLLPIRREVGDRAGEATTLNSIGLIYNNLGEPQRALEFYEQALPIFREVGDRAGEATTLHNIGRVYDKLGERQRALEFYEKKALPIFREVGDRAGEAATLHNIGRVYDKLGERQRALEFYEKKALPIFREVGDRAGEAVTLFNMARVYEAAGDLERATQLLEQTVAIDEAIASPNLKRDRAVLDALRRKLHDSKP